MQTALIVDDNQAKAELIQQELVRNAFDVHIATDIDSALSTTKRIDAYDVVGLDLYLEHGTTDPLVDHLRKMGAASRVVLYSCGDIPEEYSDIVHEVVHVTPGAMGEVSRAMMRVGGAATKKDLREIRRDMATLQASVDYVKRGYEGQEDARQVLTSTVAAISDTIKNLSNSQDAHKELCATVQSTMRETLKAHRDAQDVRHSAILERQDTILERLEAMPGPQAPKPTQPHIHPVLMLLQAAYERAPRKGKTLAKVGGVATLLFAACKPYIDVIIAKLF